MPKTNLCKPRVDPREIETRALIIGGISKYGMTRNDLAKKINAKPSTIRAHILDIRSMRLGELWDILDVIKPDEHEKGKIL